MKFIIIIIVLALLVFYFQRSNSNSKAAAENIKIGQEYLAKNALKDGIQTTASGLQYEVLQSGTGTEHPTATDSVKVNYEGTLLNGTVFDSSYKRGQPIEFKLNQVIKGWTEGLQLMTVGEKVRFFIPSDLAYGNRTMGSIPAGSTLIFDVELLGINK